MIGGDLVIDTAAHPYVARSDDLREYMRSPWRDRPFPGPEEYTFTWPKGEYLIGSRADDHLSDSGKFAQDLFGAGREAESHRDWRLPGSEPIAFADALSDAGVDIAILLPLTRGLLPDVDLDSEICAATNRWLVETWLEGKSNGHGAFFGSIRVNPSDPARAAREIHEWAGHPRMVQVAVRTQSLAPYGQRQYLPIWQAAVDHDLPVAFHVDGGSSVGFAPTAVGHISNPVMHQAVHPWNFAYHLASFLAEGVFDRLPGLRVVFADGGHEVLAPIIWRLDKDWRPNRVAMPWMKGMASSYLREHIRFCAHRLGHSPDSEVDAEWQRMGYAESIVMYASNYPKWDFLHPEAAVEGLSSELRHAILGGTAHQLFDLGFPNSSGPSLGATLEETWE